jgi:hypothetical protein
MKQKIVCYSAIFGKRDEINRFSYKNSEIDFFLFTDGNKHPDYETIVTLPSFVDSRYNARKIKCLSHKYLPPHDYSIWFDGSHSPKIDLSFLIEVLEDAKIGTFSHRFGYGWKDIAKNCMNMGWDDPKIISNQIIKYENESLPNLLAFETAVLVRKNCSIISKFNEMWWQELKLGSIRDQISFPYVLWKLGLDCKSLPGGDTVNNIFFNFNPHGSSEYKRPINPFAKIIKLL